MRGDSCLSAQKIKIFCVILSIGFPTKLTGQLKTVFRPWSYNFTPLINTGQLKTIFRPRSYNFKPLINTGQLKTVFRPWSYNFKSLINTGQLKTFLRPWSENGLKTVLSCPVFINDLKL